MNFAEQHRETITKLHAEGWSSYEIAEKLETNPSRIQRAIRFLGLPKRTYSEAQKLALKRGRTEHPTEGKALTKAHRRKVSAARAEAWKNISDEERERLSNISKAQWEAMSDSDKEELRSKAALAVREAAVSGSRAERYLRDELRKAGWSVSFHDKEIVPNTRLEVDLYIRDIKTAIEIDGPAHFLPIWGEENLVKHQAADAKKSGILLNSGLVLIRVKQLKKSVSQNDLKNMFDAIVIELEKIQKKFPKKQNRIIEVEINE